jgi:hypothetical protein
MKSRNSESRKQKSRSALDRLALTCAWLLSAFCFLLSAFPSRAQFVPMPGGGVSWRQNAVAVSGGGTYWSGPPGVSSVLTNGAMQSGGHATLSFAIADLAGSNRNEVVSFMFYPPDATFTITNTAGQSGLLLTNNHDTTYGVVNMYVFTNPPSTAHTINVYLTLTEGGASGYAAVVTNSSSAFGPMATNMVAACTTLSSNYLVSASSHLVLGHYNLGYTGTSTLVAPALTAVQSIIGNYQIANTYWQDTVWKATGSTASTNAEIYTTSNIGVAMTTIVCMHGF